MTAGPTTTAARRRAERALAGIGFTGPVSTGTLRSALEDLRGRPIHVERADRSMFVDTACGVWWECDRFDVVFVPEDADPLLRDHTVFHEFGHMIYRHHGDPACTPSAADALRSFVTRALPDLDADTVTGSLHQRTDYSGPAERDAEVLASLLTLRADADARRLRDREAESLRRALGGA